MPSTVDNPSPVHPVRPLPTRDPLPETIARPRIRLAWKGEPAAPAAPVVPAAPIAAAAATAADAGSAGAPPDGPVSRLLTALAARLITRA